MMMPYDEFALMNTITHLHNPFTSIMHALACDSIASTSSFDKIHPVQLSSQKA